MKCPKCGSEYHIGGTDVNGNLVCRACQLKEFGLLNNAQYPELYSTKTFNSVEPTPAEMLLFITKFCIRIEASIFMTKKLISICKPVRGFESLCTEEIFKLENGFDKAIKQAYDWAKQEEQNAKN